MWAFARHHHEGLRELDEPLGRVRRPGAARPRIELRDPELVECLDALVEPVSRGDPESLLRGLDYSLQGTRKTEEGKQRPDRDAPFRFIGEELRRTGRRA